MTIGEVVKVYRPDWDGSANLKCIYHDHDDSTPSMKVYPKTNTVFCFGCNRGSNVITLVSLAEGLTTNEALFKLKDLFNISEDFTEFKLKIVQVPSTEFAKTLDFYIRLFIKDDIVLSLLELNELEDLILSKDLSSLTKFKNDIFESRQ